MCILGVCGAGMSCMYRLKSEGDRTEPWGTPFGKFLMLDDRPPYDTWLCLPERKVASHLLVLLCMFVLSILFMRLCRGMASKALLMSSVMRSVLCAGLAELMPSKTLCVRSVRRVFVECNGRKPCCVGARGRCGVVSCSISRSVTLEGVQRRVMGRCEDGRVGSLLGLGMVTMIPCFQVLGMVLCE